MTVDEMKSLKKELGLTGEVIARRAGVPLSTVQKIFSGNTKAPRKLTLEAMEKAFREAAEEADMDMEMKKEPEKRVTYSFASPRADVVCEPVGNYTEAIKEDAKAGWHTLDDYYALPDDKRVELIDGKFYDMASPTIEHQTILGDLHILFRECAERHKMPCRVVLSPYDVRLDRDNYTMVQPDLMVICNKPSLDAKRQEGAPELVVEILSPSSRAKDMFLKLYKYQRAGVREYWIVDPKYKTVTVHFFEEEPYEPKKYSFDSEVPIRMTEGKCSIDFSRVLKDPWE